MAGRLYHFTRLINKYGNYFTLSTPNDGSFVYGEWVPGEPTVTTQYGAIVPIATTGSRATMADQKRFDPGGTYKGQERTLYMTTPIPGSLEGAYVYYNGERFSVMQDADYGDFDTVWIYTLQRIDKLDPDTQP